jgi:amino acid transporter
MGGPGYAVAAVLMAAFTVVNLWGVRRLSETNRAVVWWKIAVPLFAIVALIVTSFHGSNFSAGDGFAPVGVKGILSAIATGGVVFAYLGFEQAIQFGGESRNPQLNIPFAVIGSMFVGFVIYVLLQVAFLGALPAGAAAHGWANLSFTNQYWQKLVAFITSASVIIYAPQCLSLAAMRRQLPDHPRPFRLAAGGVIAPIGFVIANLIVLFAGRTTDSKLFVAVAIGFVLLAVSQLTRARADRVPLDWRSSVWMWPWLVGLGVLRWLSSFDGQNDMHFGVDMAVTAGFSLVIYFFALSRRLPDDVARERLRSGADELESADAPADRPAYERETDGARPRERTPVAR